MLIGARIGQWWILAPWEQEGLKDFSCFCIMRWLFIAQNQISQAAIIPAVIYRAEYNVVWAELKLTNIGDVAIPLVKMCLPLEKKKKKGRMEEKNVFSSVYLSSLYCIQTCLFLLLPCGWVTTLLSLDSNFSYNSLFWLLIIFSPTKNTLLMIFITLPPNKAD